jgi:hypothetical protein
LLPVSETGTTGVITFLGVCFFFTEPGFPETGALAFLLGFFCCAGNASGKQKIKKKMTSLNKEFWITMLFAILGRNYGFGKQCQPNHLNCCICSSFFRSWLSRRERLYPIFD